MNKIICLTLWLLIILLAGCSAAGSSASKPSSRATISSPSLQTETFKLPEPKLKSSVSLEEALLDRRSVRDYEDLPLAIDEISQILWAAQGITDTSGRRTAPSAGALYPLEVYMAVGEVTGLSSGVYKYRPDGHLLVKVRDGEARENLAKAALGQTPVREGAIDIVIAAVYDRTTSKYGDRGITYAHLEAGHAAQNLSLQAVALNLGSVTIGAFDDGQVKNALGLAENESPLYVIPVGKKNN